MVSFLINFVTFRLFASNSCPERTLLEWDLSPESTELEFDLSPESTLLECDLSAESIPLDWDLYELMERLDASDLEDSMWLLRDLDVWSPTIKVNLNSNNFCRS